MRKINGCCIVEHGYRIEAEHRVIDLGKEIDRLKSVERDHMTDWKRIQDAERKCEGANKRVAELESELSLKIESFGYKRCMEQIKYLESQNATLMAEIESTNALFVKHAREYQVEIADKTEALEKAIQFGEYAEWAIDSSPEIKKLDVDAREVLTKYKKEIKS